VIFELPFENLQLPVENAELPEESKQLPKRTGQLLSRQPHNFYCFAPGDSHFRGNDNLIINALLRTTVVVRSNALIPPKKSFGKN
jgi:hypothetical protein